MEMSSELPAGFRFHPTDEELIIYYLRNQVAARPCPVPFIPEVNIYKFDPWQLPGKSELCEGECYFFSPRHRKYPNGARPNRATASGYWKATGTDKAIYSRSLYVGLKKALVFYEGRPPKGVKTDWIMHEYRMGPRCSDSAEPNSAVDVLDEWVLCRIYQKKQPKRYADDCPTREASVTQVSSLGEEEQKPMLPRPCSLTHLLDPEYWSTSLLFDDNPLGSIGDIFDSRSGVDNNDDVGMKHQGSHNGLYNGVNFDDVLYLH